MGGHPFYYRGRFLAALSLSLALSLALPGCGGEEIDDVSPVVRFSFPSEFTILSGLETVRVIVNDNEGVKHVTYFADGDQLARFVVAPYTLIWNTTAYPDCTTTDSYISLTAIAEDLAGNRGTATRLFYLDNDGLPPLKVQMLPPVAVTKHSATVAWERSVDYDFSHYILYRDTSAAVTALSDSLALLDESDSTRYTDSGAGVTPFGLDEDTQYSYRVYLHDTFGRTAASDSITTIRTLLPGSVQLIEASPASKYTTSLSWPESSEDVARYRLHRGNTAAEADLDSIAGFGPATLSYSDANLTAKTDYFYHLFLIDSAGYTNRFSGDNVLPVSTDSLDVPQLVPSAAAIFKYSATLQWLAVPVQEDSSWIDLYRDTDGTVDNTSTLVISQPVPGAPVVYTDATLRQSSAYQFRLLHRDSQNNLEWSNTVGLTTIGIADVYSGGLAVSGQGKYDLSLSWDAYNYQPDDFASYSLSRNGNQIFTTTLASDLEFPDSGLQRKTTYSYELVIADTSGATLSVTLSATTRDILPAEITLVEPTVLWFYRLEWLPSAEPASEFSNYTLVRTTDQTVTFSDEDGDDVPDCIPGQCVMVAVLTSQNPAGSDTLIVYNDNDPNLVTDLGTELPIFRYAVLTYDQAGGYSPSNIVGDTLYSDPTPVTLTVDDYTTTSISLSWTRASWPWPSLEPILFLRYEVWRNTVSGEVPGEAGSSYQRVVSLVSIGETSHPDGGLEPAKSFAYSVVLVDRLGRKAISNEVIGTTLPP